MSTPRTTSVHTLKPIGLLDVADKRVRDHAGHRVRVIQPGHGCPRNGTLGHCYVECLECGAEPQLAYFIGLVLISSLEAKS
jgi:hypothetical protein